MEKKIEWDEKKEEELLESLHNLSRDELVDTFMMSLTDKQKIELWEDC